MSIPKRIPPSPASTSSRNRTVPNQIATSLPLVESGRVRTMKAALSSGDRMTKLIAGSELSALDESGKEDLEALIGPIALAISKETDPKPRLSMIHALENAARLRCDLSEAFSMMAILLGDRDRFVQQSALFIVNSLINNGDDITLLIRGVLRVLTDREEGGKRNAMIATKMMNTFASRSVEDAGLLLARMSNLPSDHAYVLLLQERCRATMEAARSIPPRPEMPTISEADARDTMPAPPSYPGNDQTMDVSMAVMRLRGQDIRMRREANNYLARHIDNPETARDVLSILGPDDPSNELISGIRKRCVALLKSQLPRE